MTTGGWIIMLISTISVTSLFVWCIVKVLSGDKGDSTMHGFEIDTPDKD